MIGKDENKTSNKAVTRNECYFSAHKHTHTHTYAQTQALMLSAKLNLLIYPFQHCCFVRHSKLVK